MEKKSAEPTGDHTQNPVPSAMDITEAEGGEWRFTEAHLLYVSFLLRLSPGLHKVVLPFSCYLLVFPKPSLCSPDCLGLCVFFLS